MPVKIINGECEGTPAIFCDACGREIRGEGNYHWRWGDEERGGATVYFSCKGNCAFAVDRREKTELCMDLDDFFQTLKKRFQSKPRRSPARR
jgi:hypothetical protein